MDLPSLPPMLMQTPPPLDSLIKGDHKILLLTNEFNLRAKELQQWVPLTGVTNRMMSSITQKQLILLSSGIAY